MYPASLTDVPDVAGLSELLYEHEIVTDYTPYGDVEINGQWDRLSRVYGVIRGRYLTGTLSVNGLLASFFEDFEEI